MLNPTVVAALVRAGTQVATAFCSGAAIVVGMAVGAKLAKRMGGSIPVSVQAAGNVTPIRPKQQQPPAA